MLKRKVTKPYSPIADVSTAEAIPKEGVYMWSPQQVPASVPLSSTFGSSTNWFDDCVSLSSISDFLIRGHWFAGKLVQLEIGNWLVIPTLHARQKVFCFFVSTVYHFGRSKYYPLVATCTNNSVNRLSEMFFTSKASNHKGAIMDFSLLFLCSINLIGLACHKSKRVKMWGV